MTFHAIIYLSFQHTDNPQTAPFTLSHVSRSQFKLFPPCAHLDPKKTKNQQNTDLISIIKASSSTIKTIPQKTSGLDTLSTATVPPCQPFRVGQETALVHCPLCQGPAPVSVAAAVVSNAVVSGVNGSEEGRGGATVWFQRWGKRFDCEGIVLKNDFPLQSA